MISTDETSGKGYEKVKDMWLLPILAGSVVIWVVFRYFLSKGRNKVLQSSEAMTILEKALGGYRNKSYDELRNLVGEVEALEVVSGTGVKYSLELQVFWDGGVGGNIRVTGSVDDQGLSTFSPVSLDFIKSKDGTFIGEDC